MNILNSTKRIVYIGILIFMFVIIFLLSEQNGTASTNSSNTFIELLAKKITYIKRLNEFFDISFLIRKLAHFFLYFIIGIDSILLLNTYNLKLCEKISISILIGVSYAVFDEIHQTFVYGRAGKFIDVIIDGAGIIVGILIMYLIINLYNKKTM